jgi:hypothetical protein
VEFDIALSAAWTEIGIVNDLDTLPTADSGPKQPEKDAGASAVAFVGLDPIAPIRATYVLAFTRFLAGLLDSRQDGRVKKNMFNIAKELGIPGRWVELRHEAVHGRLPELGVWRKVVKEALAWLESGWWREVMEGFEKSKHVGGVKETLREWKRDGGKPEEAVKVVMRMVDEKKKVDDVVDALVNREFLLKKGNDGYVVQSKVRGSMLMRCDSGHQITLYIVRW